MRKKEILRKKLKNSRSKLVNSYVTSNSSKIFNTLKNLLNQLSFNSIAVYKSFNNEVLTNDIIIYCLSMDKIVCLPVLKDLNTMEFHQINARSKMKLNMYGISEPINSSKINTNKIDIIIIPCLGFNENLYRIGMGKGYYDKILEDNESSTLICLAFEDQLIDEDFEEKHDIRMNYIITENSILF